MTAQNFVITILLLAFFTSCVEKTGYYEPGEQKIIDNLTKNKSWEREYQPTLNNVEKHNIHEIWIFKDNGSGSYKVITTFENGKTKENITYFKWGFTIPNFSVIYMDYGLFWEIKELTPIKLRIYETYKDPITVPGQMYRDYREYDAIPLDD